MNMNKFFLGLVTGATLAASANWAVADKPAVEAPKVTPTSDVLDIQLRSGIVNYAEKNLGKVIGRGDATDLVDAALDAAGAKPKVVRRIVLKEGGVDEIYEWGTEKKSYRGPEGAIGKLGAVPLDPRFPDVKGRRQYLLRSGDIIQFTSAVFKTDEYSWSLGAPRHTAIVKSANASGTVVLLHQNVPKGSGVKELTLNFNSLLKGGSYVAYAPELKGAKATSTPATTKSPQLIVCSPINWVQVDIAAGKRWFGSDIPGMREEPETSESLVAKLKKYGFEVQYRRVLMGFEMKLDLSARLTKETRTPYTDVGKRDGLNREVGAIADMVYGGAKALGRNVYYTK
jgi:hypothetical protein